MRWFACPLPARSRAATRRQDSPARGSGTLTGASQGGAAGMDRSRGASLSEGAQPASPPAIEHARITLVDVHGEAGTARGIFGLPDRELARGASLAGVTDRAATTESASRRSARARRCGGAARCAAARRAGCVSRSARPRHGERGLGRDPPRHRRARRGRPRRRRRAAVRRRARCCRR